MANNRLRKILVSASTKETAYDTAQTVDSLMRVTNGSIPNLNVQTIKDDDHISGLEEAGEQEVIAYSGAMPFQVERVKPHTLAFIASYGLGSVSSAAADTGTPATFMKKHTMTPLANQAMPSFTVEHFIASGIQRKLSGGLVNDFTLSIQRGANRFVKLAANLLLSGTDASGSGSATEKSETSLQGGTTTAVWLSAAGYSGSTDDDIDYATSDLNATAFDNTAVTQNIEWVFNNNFNEDDLFLIGQGLGLSNNDRTSRSQEVRWTFEMSAYSEISSLFNQTEIALQVKCRGAQHASDSGYYYGFNVVWPLLQYQDVQIVEINGRVYNQAVFTVLEHATHGSVILDVFNAQSGYLA